MSLTFTRDSNYPEMSWGAFKVVFGKMAFDSNYLTGGLTLSAGQVGAVGIFNAIIPTNSGYVFDYDQTTGKVKVADSAGGTLTSTPFAADTINIVDDAAAATKNPVFLRMQGQVPLQFCLAADKVPLGVQAPTSLVTVSNTGGTRFLGVRGDFITDFIIRLTHDAAAAANGTRVYFQPDATSGGVGFQLGRFVSNNAGAVNGTFTTVDGGGTSIESIPVFYDANPTYASYSVGVVQTNSDGNRIIVDSAFNQDCYVQTQSGRYVHLKSTALAGNPILYFNIGAADTSRKLLFVSGTATSTTNALLPNFGDSDIDRVGKFAVKAKASVVAGSYTLAAAVPLYADGTVFYIRLLDRVLPITVDSTGTGTSIFWDETQTSANKLRANLGTGDGTIALSRTNAPEGFTPTYSLASGTFGEVANGTDLSSLTAVDCFVLCK